MSLQDIWVVEEYDNDDGQHADWRPLDGDMHLTKREAQESATGRLGYLREVERVRVAVRVSRYRRVDEVLKRGRRCL